MDIITLLIIGVLMVLGFILGWIPIVGAVYIVLVAIAFFITGGDEIGIIIIGGLGTTIGPIFGVLFIRILQKLMTLVSPIMESAIPTLPAGFTTGIGPMIFGLAIILFLILEPRGLAHRWALLRASYRLWPF